MSWLIGVAAHPWRYTGLPAIPVSTKPYTGSHPYRISSHPAVIPRREVMYKSISAVSAQLSEHPVSFGQWDAEVWGSMVGGNSYCPSLVTKGVANTCPWWSGQTHYSVEAEARGDDGTPLLSLHQIQAQKSPAWHAVHPCTKEVQRTIPSAAPPLLLLPATPLGGRHCPPALLAKEGVFPVFCYFSQGHHRWI